MPSSKAFKPCSLKIILRIITPDGVEKVLQGKSEVLVDEANKPYKLLGTYQDVTHQFRLNEQLERQRDQLARKNIELERSNRELTAFNYIASHDLQEPVRKIKLFSNRLLHKAGPELSAGLRDYVEKVSFSADYMQQLIESLLAFSRTASTEKTLETVNLNDLIEAVKISLKEEIEEKKARFFIGELPVVSVVKLQFHQLFENMLQNALKYSRAGLPPHIQIEAQLVSGQSLHAAGAFPERWYHQISVSDNGIGFDQQYAEKVFELFQRLHGKNEFSGTGVGLAICKKIMENHQGLITAESRPGAGASFRIYLPATH